MGIDEYLKSLDEKVAALLNEQPGVQPEAAAKAAPKKDAGGAAESKSGAQTATA